MRTRRDPTVPLSLSLAQSLAHTFSSRIHNTISLCQGGISGGSNQKEILLNQGSREERIINRINEEHPVHEK